MQHLKVVDTNILIIIKQDLLLSGLCHSTINVKKVVYIIIFSYVGTGKTYTGIKLVYLFDLINDMLRVDGHSHQQVVFCGPNNKSVDLVASKI